MHAPTIDHLQFSFCCCYFVPNLAFAVIRKLLLFILAYLDLRKGPTLGSFPDLTKVHGLEAFLELEQGTLF